MNRLLEDFPNGAMSAEIIKRNDPANNRLRNLWGFCQRCHLLHDRPFHLAQRWLTYRRRWAMGDLFLGRYGIRPPLFVTLIEKTRVPSIRTQWADVPTARHRTGDSVPQLFV